MARHAYRFILAAYCAVTLIAVATHEPWRDEAYVWLMARDLDFAGLVSELKYNGAPGLWHALVFLLAKAGLPYASQQYLHWALACVAAGLFLYKSPFNSLLKALFLFSYFIVYEHAVIVRVYLIALPLLYAACILFPVRLHKPVWYGAAIGLLANSNLFGLVAAALFGAEYLFALLRAGYYGAGQAAGLALMLLGGFISASSVFPTADGFDYYHELLPFYDPVNAVRGPVAAFFGEDGISPWLMWSAAALCLCLVALAIRLMWRRKAYFPLALLAAMWLLIAYVTVFQYRWPGPRHFSFYLIFTLVSLWLASYRRAASDSRAERGISGLLAFALSFNVYAGVSSCWQEVELPFSASTDMARYIGDNHLEGRIFVGYRCTLAASILPYLPGLRMWYPQLEAFGTYLHMVPQTRGFLTKGQVVELAGRDLPGEDVLFIFDHPLAVGDPELELLAYFGGWRESFWLYRKPQGQVGK